MASAGAVVLGWEWVSAKVSVSEWVSAKESV
jgi:hypothetical protein